MDSFLQGRLITATSPDGPSHDSPWCPRCQGCQPVGFSWPTVHAPHSATNTSTFPEPGALGEVISWVSGLARFWGKPSHASRPISLVSPGTPALVRFMHGVRGSSQGDGVRPARAWLPRAGVRPARAWLPVLALELWHHRRRREQRRELSTGTESDTQTPWAGSEASIQESGQPLRLRTPG